MRPVLTVARLGHVNAVTGAYQDMVDLQRDVLGAAVFREWQHEGAGSRNALALVGRTCIETLTPTSSEHVIGRWLTAYGPGWHSVQWTVPAMDVAMSTIAERGMRITERSETHCFIHPKAMHGLMLELSDARIEGDPRDWPDSPPSSGLAEHRLGIVGNARIKVASLDPKTAADDLADLVGLPAYAVEHPHLNARGCGVHFLDHSVEFVGSATDVSTDLVGTFLARHGERMYCLTFQVADLSAARAYLAGADQEFDQFGRHSLMLRAATAQGLRIEFSDED